MELPVTCDSLGELDDGAARAIVDAAIREAVFDTYDRGGDEKPRQVNIIIEMKQMENGLVITHVEAAAKVPRRRTAATVTQVKHEQGRPKLMFQSHAPEDPTQRTLDEVERKKAQEGDTYDGADD